MILAPRPSYFVAFDLALQSTVLTVYTGQFISPSGISDLCGKIAGMVTPKGSMSTEGETLIFCPSLQVLDMSTLGDVAQSCN